MVTIGAIYEWRPLRRRDQDRWPRSRDWHHQESTYPGSADWAAVCPGPHTRRDEEQDRDTAVRQGRWFAAWRPAGPCPRSASGQGFAAATRAMAFVGLA